MKIRRCCPPLELTMIFPANCPSSRRRRRCSGNSRYASRMSIFDSTSNPPITNWFASGTLPEITKT